MINKNVIIIDNKIYEIKYLYKNDLGSNSATYIDIEIIDYFEYDEERMFLNKYFIIYDGIMIQYDSSHVESWIIDNDVVNVSKYHKSINQLPNIITLKMKAYEQFSVKDIKRDENTEVALDYYKNILRLKKLDRIIN